MNNAQQKIAESFTLYIVLRDAASITDEVVIQRLETEESVRKDILSRFTTIYTEWLDSTIIDYTPSYNVSANEIFQIEDFQEPSRLKNTVSKRMQFQEFNMDEAIKKGFTVKAFLGTHQRADASIAYYYQIIDKRHLLDQGSKWYGIVRLNNLYKKLNEEALTFGDHLSIIIDTRSSRLLFRSFRDASLMLDLTSAFREATESDIRNILSCDKVKNAPAEIQKIIELCDNPMRKKFAIIQHEGILDNERVRPILVVEKAKEFGIDIALKGKGESAKLVFPTEKESLKLFLKFLCQDYYESILTGDKCISNSHRRLS